MIKIYAQIILLHIFSIYGQSNDEKLVPLRSPCISSVQCVGVSVCLDRICRCPLSYTAIGNTCVHSGFDQGLSSDRLQLFSSSLFEKDTKNTQNQNGIGSNFGLNDKNSNMILGKITTSTSIPSTGYPGQSCGIQNECRGNSFCYKNICSCHAGAIVSGRICATITKSSTATSIPKIKPTTRSTSRPATPSSRQPLGVEQICPPPLFWADGDCMVPATVPSIVKDQSGSTRSIIYSTTIARLTGICRPPLVLVEGWCMLPGSLPGTKFIENHKSTRMPPSTATILINRCLPPSIWVDGRCINPQSSIFPRPISFPFITPLVPPSPSFNPSIPLPGIDAGVPIPTIQTRRCPPGEILINSACLSTAVVVNYPSPLLCRTNVECPGGATCLSHFCVCPAPFVWHSKLGCDSPSLTSISIDMTPIRDAVRYQNDQSISTTKIDSRNFNPLSITSGSSSSSTPIRQTANGYAPLGGRCRRDNDCLERAVCEFNICACRAPFVPYSNMCIFAPTEEEIASAIQ